MTHDDDIARHYATQGLLDRIDAALTSAGVDPARPGIDDLKPVDEFHTGGIEATTELLGQVSITPGMTVIDVGAGLGGTARHIAHRHGAKVHGIDLTDAFVQAGRVLNDRLGIGEQVTLVQGSALAMPFDTGFADLVTMFHVGMNIENKTALFAEVARVLRPGGQFALFDVMRDSDDAPLILPVPWAEHADLSHVAAPGIYRRAAFGAGLEEVAERERRTFALDFFARISRHIAAEGLPPVGLHLLMGDSTAEKLANYVANLEARRIAPVEMIFRRP